MADHAPDFDTMPTPEIEMAAAHDARLSIRGCALAVCGVAALTGGAEAVAVTGSALEWATALGGSLTATIGVHDFTRYGARASNAVDYLRRRAAETPNSEPFSRVRFVGRILGIYSDADPLE